MVAMERRRHSGFLLTGAKYVAVVSYTPNQKTSEWRDDIAKAKGAQVKHFLLYMLHLFVAPWQPCASHIQWTRPLSLNP